MAKAKTAKKKAAPKAKVKVKTKVQAKTKAPVKAKTKMTTKVSNPTPAKKASVTPPAVDSGLAKRVAALESAVAALKKTTGGTGNADAITKAIDIAATEIRQRAEDSDHVAMAEVRKHVDKVQAELVEADARLHSEIGAVAAQGDLKQDDIQVMRRKLDELEARISAKK